MAVQHLHLHFLVKMVFNFIFVELLRTQKLRNENYSLTVEFEPTTLPVEDQSANCYTIVLLIWFCSIIKLIYDVLYVRSICARSHESMLFVGIAMENNQVKYKRTDVLSLWHQQLSTTVYIHGPLQTRGETRCPGGVSVSCLASRTRHECPRHNESVYMEAWHWMWTDTI